METLKCITHTYSHDKVFQNVLGQIHSLHVRVKSRHNTHLSTKSVGRSFKNSCLKRTAAPYVSPRLLKILSSASFFIRSVRTRKLVNSSSRYNNKNKQFHCRSLNVLLLKFETYNQGRKLEIIYFVCHSLVYPFDNHGKLCRRIYNA